jgi:hypothetical protein
VDPIDDVYGVNLVFLAENRLRLEIQVEGTKRTRMNLKCRSRNPEFPFHANFI